MTSFNELGGGKSKQNNTRVRRTDCERETTREQGETKADRLCKMSDYEASDEDCIAFDETPMGYLYEPEYTRIQNFISWK